MPKKKFPKVTFRNAEPLQDYYQLGDEYYSVARLIDETKHLTPFDVPIASLNLDDPTWNGENLYGIAFHVKKVYDADLSFPIIIDWDGRIADGRHRIIKAIVKGRRTIKAVRMTWKITPDRIDKDD